MSTIATLSTSDTPADTLITKFNANFSALNTDKLEASDIAWKQDTLVSWTNIKTINWVTILGSGDLSIPTLTDGDKGDLTLTSSGTVWTIDNDVVTNAKLANVASATFKGRTTVGAGDVEDLTSLQATALLDVATTSLKGLMSSSDKTKLDGLANEWTALTSSSFTAGGTYNTGALTTYDTYKIEIQWQTTWASWLIRLRYNSSGSAVYWIVTMSQSWSYSSTSWNTEHTIFTTNSGSGYRYVATYYVDRLLWQSYWNASFVADWSNTVTVMKNWYFWSAITSIQLNVITAISWNIKVYGKNY